MEREISAELGNVKEQILPKSWIFLQTAMKYRLLFLNLANIIPDENFREPCKYFKRKRFTCAKFIVN